MISNFLNNIGCNAKIPFKRLNSIMEEVFSQSLLSSWEDCTPVKKTRMATSIDTVKLIGSHDLELDIISAINHCLSDLVSNGYKPMHLNISIAFNSDISSDKRISNAIRIIKDYTCKYDIQIGKSHSILGSEDTITVASLGRKIIDQLVIQNGAIYDLILTKELGLLRSLIIGQEEADLNSTILKRIQHELSLSPLEILYIMKPAYSGSTDISGYSLAGSLITLSKKQSLCIKIKPRQLKYPEIRDDAQTIFCATDHNREAFKKYLKFENRITKHIEELIFSSEFSGPLLLITPQKQTKKFLKNLNKIGFEQAHVIGKCMKTDEPEVILQ